MTTDNKPRFVQALNPMKALHCASTALFAVVFSLSAYAAPITFNFTGTVGAVDSALSSSFAPGDSLTGSYTFESTTAARAGSTTNFSVFDALSSLSLSIGSYSAATTGAPEIQIDNNPGLPNHDRYGVVARASDGLTGPSVAGNTLSFFGFRLDDATDTVFSDALVLPSTVSLASFDSNAFFLFFKDTAGGLLFLSGNLKTLSAPTTSVPEPASLAVLAIGMAIVVARRRRGVRLS